MAVGDPVIIVSAAGTAIDYQPAAGVTVMITQVVMDSAVAIAKIWNGANASTYIVGGNVANYLTISGNMKLLIDNTNYFRMDAQGATIINYACGFVVASP